MGMKLFVLLLKVDASMFLDNVLVKLGFLYEIEMCRIFSVAC